MSSNTYTAELALGPCSVMEAGREPFQLAIKFQPPSRDIRGVLSAFFSGMLINSHEYICFRESNGAVQNG